VRQIVDAEGTIVNAKDYDSFGNILDEMFPANGDRFDFTGREREAAIDLLWYRARWYDPAPGRFISEDPIGFRASDLNLTTYVFNRPTNLTDPSGQRAFRINLDPEARRGRGPWGDSAQHCWVACMAAAIGGPLIGICVVVSGDFAELVVPIPDPVDTIRDIAAQHFGELAGYLIFPRDPFTASWKCDVACSSFPL
jgi:RHS repeat-associated protein